MKDYWKLINAIYTSEFLKSSANTKVGVFERVFQNLNFEPETLAFLSYNPIVEVLADKYDVYVLDDYKDLVSSKSIKCFSMTEDKTFNAVFGIDEHLTYCNSEQQQKDNLSKIKNICNGYFITTLADYKNSAPFKKTQIEIVEYKNQHIIIENHLPLVDKQAWYTYHYYINPTRTLQVVGPYQRRTLYFKQLAKYASDLGSREYVIQKDALYKGFAKRHWEHIITVRF